jgi:tripartite ATP-independent transporter DctM subunit
MLAFFFLGAPVAFSMLIACFLYVIVNNQIGEFTTITTTLWFGVDSYALIAVPLFMLAAELMNESKITDKIFCFANTLVGRIPGSLGHVNVLASMIFAGMSGSSLADASGLGRLEIKAMKDAKYDAGFSAAVTASSASIGPIIPPSISMVVAGVITSTSVGKLLLGGFLPGCLMGFGLMIVVYIKAKQRQYPTSGKPKLREVLSAFKSAVLAMLTPVILIMGIFSGIFTPTEAAAVCCVYALLIVLFVYRGLNIRNLFKVFCTVGLRCATVLFVFSAACVFGRMAVRAQLPQLLADTMMSITQNPLGVLFIMLAMFFILGFFMEDLALLVILGPILVPIIVKLGVDPIHFGVLMVMSLQMAMMTPPVGLNMYIVCYYAEIDMITYVKELWPFFLILVGVALSVLLFPKITLLIPDLMRF